jgi:hypothetical protein
MGDFGIKTSIPGKNVFDAEGTSLNFDTNKPFIKIDTQNEEGFKTITLIMVTDPPEPVGPATDTYTILYQFAHGYDYVPSVETLFYVTNPPALAVVWQDYFQDFGVLSQRTAFDAATLYAVADATNVYIVCNKYKVAGFGLPNVLSGANIDITTHVFVEDIGN